MKEASNRRRRGYELRRDPESAPIPRRTRQWGLGISIGVVLLATAIVVGSLYNIQIRNGEMYSRYASDQQLLDTSIQATRGEIYDATGKVLASTSVVWDIWCDPSYSTALYDSQTITSTNAGGEEVESTVRTLDAAACGEISRELTLRLLSGDGVSLDQVDTASAAYAQQYEAVYSALSEIDSSYQVLAEKVNNAVKESIEKYVSDRFRNGLDQLTSCRRQAMLIRTAAGRMSEFSLILGVAAMIVIGLMTGESMASLKISLGVFAVAAYKIIPSVNRIINYWIEYRRNLFAAEKIAATLDRIDEIHFLPPSAERLPFRSGIDFDRVTFRYETDGKAILDNVSLHIAKGERLGIKGRSGAGKTTLLNILCGFFTPESGRLTIDGVPLTADNRRAWQNNIAYVSQEVFLPDIPLAENIAFGVPQEQIDPDRLRRSIEAASLTSFVDALPDGVRTITGEAGCRLSGGQRQRVGIARALYKEASILLFDEATSSLDSRTELEIVEAIEHLSASQRELTILIISHRERTLDFCDRIVEITETHD